MLELDGERAAVVNKTRDWAARFIDDSGFEEIESEPVRQRKQMAYDGMITLIVTLNADTGVLHGDPEIVTRGVRGFDASNGNLKDAQRIVAAAIAGASRETLSNATLLKEHIRVELKRFVQKLTGARPVIMPVVLQV